jgi:DNA-binding Lrp family transcriptional regulator
MRKQSLSGQDLTAQMIAILRRNGRASYTEIAREIGANREYVASRINPLIEAGQLRIVAGVHPRALGFTISAHLSIKTAGDTGQVIEALDALEAPALISVVAGAFQIVVELQLKALTELKRQVSAIRVIPGVLEVYVHLYDRILNTFFLDAEPRALAELDATDMDIVRRLVHDGRANFADLAQEAGLSVSGCRTRVQRLLESGVIQIGAIKQRCDLAHELVFGIGLNASDDCDEAVEILGAHPGLEFLARTVGRFDLLATVEFASLRDFNALIARLRSLRSVEYCEQWLHVRIVRERYLQARSGPVHRSNGIFSATLRRRIHT